MDKERIVDILSTLRRPFVLILAILLISDAVTTFIGLNQTGFVETNPLIRFIASQIGVFWAIFITKGVALTALAAHETLIARNEYRSPLMANVMGHIVFVPLIVLYIFIVQNNIALLLG